MSSGRGLRRARLSPYTALLLGLSGRGALITTCEYCYEPRCMKTREVRTRKGNNGRDARIEFLRPGVLRRRAFVTISSARQGYALRAFSRNRISAQSDTVEPFGLLPEGRPVDEDVAP